MEKCHCYKAGKETECWERYNAKGRVESNERAIIVKDEAMADCKEQIQNKILLNISLLLNNQEISQ